MTQQSLVLALTCSLALAIIAPAAASQPSMIPVIKPPDFSKQTPQPVVRVVEGDTIVIDLAGKITTVRLIGVDAPETEQPHKPAKNYGKEAARFTTNLLKGERVYLISDPKRGRLDRDGSVLAYVYRAPDGLFVNAEIIRQGYGRARLKHPLVHLAAFKRLEGLAKEARRGLWATPKSTTRPTTKKKEPPKPPSKASIITWGPSQPRRQGTIKEFWDRYHKAVSVNVTQAEREYKNLNVLVTGTVSSVSKRSESIPLIIIGGSEGGTSISLEFPKRPGVRSARLNKGDRVTVRGKFDTKFRRVRQCVLQHRRPGAEPPVAKPGVPGKADDARVVVYVTRTGKAYHRALCSTLRGKSRSPVSLKDARTRGYTPCSECKPPR